MPIDHALTQSTTALGEDLSLLVAYEIPDGFEARNVNLGQPAADGLRTLGRDWLDGVGGQVVVSYEATAELGDGEVFLVEDADVLTDFAPLYEFAAQASELPPLAVDQVDRRISVYGVVAGDANRIGFFKRSDPRIGFSGGRRLLAVLGERLERLEEPAFAFYSSFDFVLAEAWALIVNQGAFEKLFRDAGLVEQHIDQWVTGIEQYLPWADGAVAALTEVAHRDSRVWRRLREINRRGHLATVTIDQVREYVAEMGLDEGELIVDDRLVFDPDDRFSILHLLNEDLFRGLLTHERFEAQRKTGA